MKSNKSVATAVLILSINYYLITLPLLVSSCNTCGGQQPNYPRPGGGGGHCPRDALKLGVCAKVLNGPVNAVVGTPPTLPCCSVIEGLLDLEAAICLCTAIKANILGINLNIPLTLSLLINACGKSHPQGFTCA